MPNIEKIVRGVIIHDGKILLCKNVHGNYYFLPGGHIEGGESPELALSRELKEEIDRSPVRSERITQVNNFFIEKGESHTETVTIYKVELDNYKNIRSNESHIEFEWLSTPMILRIDFRPKQIVQTIHNLTS